MKKILMILAVVSALFPLTGTDLNESVYEDIQKLILKDVKSIKHGGISFALADQSELLYSQGFGWADKAASIQMEGDSPSAVASVTKLFTAVAVVQLASQGKLDLDMPAAHYIPGFSLRGTEDEEVTIRLMLTHYSALPSDYLKGYRNSRKDYENIHSYFPELLHGLSEEQKTAEGGSFYRYSNTGYELLAYIVSLVSGISFPEYVKKNILEPLNMNNSGFPGSSTLEGIMAKGYTVEGETPLIHMRGTGEGDMISSAEDLTRFGSVFLSSDETILENCDKSLMLSKHNSGNLYDFDLYRGLGWYRMEIPGFPEHYYYYHEGGTSPYSSLMIIIPEFSLSFSLLANEEEKSFDKISIDILTVLMEEITGKKPVRQYAGKERTAPVDPSFYGAYSTELGLMTIGDSLTGPVLDMMGMKLHIKREKGGFYGLEYRLLGLIPLPVSDLKGIKFRFQDRDFKSFGIYTRGKYRGLGTLVTDNTVHDEWRDRMGEYRIVNNDEMNFLTSFSLRVNEETEHPVITVSVSTIPGEMTFPVDLSSADAAYIHGKGRHLGDRIGVLSQNDKELLLYSGYYLERE